MTVRRLPLIEPETLPERLGIWANRLLDGGIIPREVHATCESCAMVPEEPGGAQTSFNPRTKCCTYLPELPNFTVGAILSGPPGPGPDSVRRRIERRVSLTPLGLGHPPPDLDQRRIGGPFGQDVAHLCDHHHDNGCSIWQHREVVCATYFCKYERGAVALRFWETLKAALSATERAVARGCALRAGLPPASFAALQELPMKSVLPSTMLEPASHRRLWGRWAGDEAGFFIECARIADTLSWEEIQGWGGVELAALTEATRHEHRALLQPTLPEHPVCQSFTIRPSASDAVQVVAYSSVDAIALPPAVISALSHFDGRPRAEAVESARDRERVELTEDLLQMLSDFGVIAEREDG